MYVYSEERELLLDILLGITCQHMQIEEVNQKPRKKSIDSSTQGKLMSIEHKRNDDLLYIKYSQCNIYHTCVLQSPACMNIISATLEVFIS